MQKFLDLQLPSVSTSILGKSYFLIKKDFLKKFKGKKLVKEFFTIVQQDELSFNLIKFFIKKEKFIPFVKGNLKYLLQIYKERTFDLLCKIFIIATNYGFQKIVVNSGRNSRFLRKLSALRTLQAHMYTQKTSHILELDFLCGSLRDYIISRFFMPYSRKLFYGENQFLLGLMEFLKVLENRIVPINPFPYIDFREAIGKNLKSYEYDFNAKLRISVKNLLVDSSYNKLEIFSNKFNFWFYFHKFKPRIKKRSLKQKGLSNQVKTLLSKFNDSKYLTDSLHELDTVDENSSLVVNTLLHKVNVENTSKFDLNIGVRNSVGFPFLVPDLKKRAMAAYTLYYDEDSWWDQESSEDNYITEEEWETFSSLMYYDKETHQINIKFKGNHKFYPNFDEKFFFQYQLTLFDDR